MALSSDTVMVMVEGDLLPDLTLTLKDANGNTVSRAGFTAVIVCRPIGGGTATRLTGAWLDSPTNTRVTHAWTTATRLAVGVWYVEVETDPNGASDQWTFPTETPCQLVVRAGMG